LNGHGCEQQPQHYKGTNEAGLEHDVLLWQGSSPEAMPLDTADPVSCQCPDAHLSFICGVIVQVSEAKELQYLLVSSA
jgi:hypothetical protein